MRQKKKKKDVITLFPVSVPYRCVSQKWQFWMMNWFNAVLPFCIILRLVPSITVQLLSVPEVKKLQNNTCDDDTSDDFAC
jgi:hypothetical protein